LQAECAGLLCRIINRERKKREKIIKKKTLQVPKFEPTSLNERRSGKKKNRRRNFKEQ
jgi:hypothetical protein